MRPLAHRQISILDLLAERGALTRREIATALDLGLGTVQTYVCRLKNKRVVFENERRVAISPLGHQVRENPGMKFPDADTEAPELTADQIVTSARSCAPVSAFDLARIPVLPKRQGAYR